MHSIKKIKSKRNKEVEDLFVAFFCFQKQISKKAVKESGMEFTIKAAGDRALAVEFENMISEETNRKVYHLQDWIIQQNIKGIEETVPTFRSLLILYSPEKIRFNSLVRKLEKYRPKEGGEDISQKKVMLIPCCYEGSFAPDLEDMSRELEISRDEIIAIHSSTDYRIYMMGFLPGFVYLGGLDKRICIPRLKIPRLWIPAGAVGIGGDQTGIYPMESPGGWRIIGSTPLDLYDPKRKEPVLCRCGEYIRFVPIERDEYTEIKKEVSQGNYRACCMEG